MNPTRSVVLVVLVWILLCGAASAGTEQSQAALPRKPAAREGAGAQKPLSPAEVQSIIDGWVVVQAQTALGLTDAQFPQFVMRLRELQETRRRNLRARNQLIQELARLTNPKNPPADEAQVREKLKALDDLETKSAAELRKAHENVDQVLDVRQQARLRVFLDQVERRMLEILMKARAQTAAGSGPVGAGPGGRR